MTDSPPLVTTSASALHDILSAIRSNAGSLETAWAKVLKTKWNTSEFALRYSEVASLLTDVVNDVESLRNGAVKEKALRFLPSWWQALVIPQHQWQNAASSLLISDKDLDVLSFIGEIIYSDKGGRGKELAEKDLSNLKAECVEWLAVLKQSDEIEDESLRRVMVEHISHLIWLIDNASLFGVDKIIQKGDQVTGMMARAATEADSEAHALGLWKRVGKFATALAVITSIITGSTNLAHDVQKALPPAEKIIKELTSGPAKDAGQHPSDR